MKNYGLLQKTIAVVASAALISASLIGCGSDGDDGTKVIGEQVTEQEWDYMTSQFLEGWHTDSVTANLVERHIREDEYGLEPPQISTVNYIWKIDLKNQSESFKADGVTKKGTEEISRYNEKYVFEYGGVRYVYDDGYYEQSPYVGEIGDFGVENVVKRIDQDGVQVCMIQLEEKEFLDFEFDASDGSYTIPLDEYSELKIYFKYEYLYRVRLEVGESYDECYFTDIGRTVVDEPPDEAIKAVEDYIAEKETMTP